MKTFISSSKRVLAVMLALLTLCTGLAVGASAADTLTVTATASKTKSEVTVTVTKPDGYTIDKSDVVVTLVTTTTVQTCSVYADGNNFVIRDLTAGNEYTITVTAKKDTATITGSATVKLLNTQSAPGSLTVTKKGIDSNGKAYITLNYMSGALYACVPSGSATNPAAEPTDSAYTTSNTFTDLLPATYYDFYAKYPATTTQYESTTTKTQAKTVAKGDNKTPAAVSLVNVTSSTIKVTYIDGYEYSIDEGKTWQDSNEFKSLTAGKTYFILQRIKVDESVQQVNPSSAAFSVKVNTAAQNICSISSVAAPAFKESDKIYKDNDNTIYAYAVTRTSGSNQWGDIQYVPYTYEIYNGSSKETTGNFTKGSNGTYSASFKPQYANSSYKIRVIYAKQRYGIAAEIEKTEDKKVTSDGFVNLDTTTNYKDISFTSKDKPSKFEEYLSAIINFLTDTLPKFIVKAITFLRDNHEDNS